MKAKEIARMVLDHHRAEIERLALLPKEEVTDEVLDKSMLESINVGFKALLDQMVGRYMKLHQDNSKVSLLRDTFQLWRAVVANLRLRVEIQGVVQEAGLQHKYVTDALFLQFYATAMPDLYVLMHERGVFGGYDMSPYEKQQLVTLREQLVKKLASEQRMREIASGNAWFYRLLNAAMNDPRHTVR